MAMNKNLQPIKKGARLSQAQKTKLQAHQRAKQLSSRHMSSMRMAMLKGSSFQEAHEKASMLNKE
jgi:hypothetical protein